MNLGIGLAFGVVFIFYGIITLCATGYNAFFSFFDGLWDDVAKQVTINFSTIGMALFISGSLFIYISMNT